MCAWVFEKHFLAFILWLVYALIRKPIMGGSVADPVYFFLPDPDQPWTNPDNTLYSV